MNVVLCTLCDRNYLARALVMVRSLRRHWGGTPPGMFLLCLDSATEVYLQQHPEPGVTPLSLAWLEQADPELASAQGDRSRLEYYFTLSPCLPRMILREFQPDAVVSCDADLWFLDDGAFLVDLLRRRSLFITAHGFSPAMRELGIPTGRFNVSFQGFRNDAVGRACLDQWRRQCLEWCRHVVDETHGRYGDQRYLDSWPTDFSGSIQILEPPTFGLAPWNLARFRLSASAGRLWADEEPVRYFHFHGVRLLAPHLAADRLSLFDVRPDEVVLQDLYAPYLRELFAAEDEVARELGLSRPLFESRREGPLWWRLWQARTACRLDPQTGRIQWLDYTSWHPVDTLQARLGALWRFLSGRRRT